MASDYIKVDTTITTATKARALVDLVRAMREAYEQVVYVKSIMDHNFTPGNFAALEALFGLAPNTGTTVYDMVNGAHGAMTNVFQNDQCKNLTERVG
jgi:hypothetical protein